MQGLIPKTWLNVEKLGIVDECGVINLQYRFRSKNDYVMQLHAMEHHEQNFYYAINPYSQMAPIIEVEIEVDLVDKLSGKPLFNKKINHE